MRKQIWTGVALCTGLWFSYSLRAHRLLHSCDLSDWHSVCAPKILFDTDYILIFYNLLLRLFLLNWVLFLFPSPILSTMNTYYNLVSMTKCGLSSWKQNPDYTVSGHRLDFSHHFPLMWTLLCSEKISQCVYLEYIKIKWLWNVLKTLHQYICQMTFEIWMRKDTVNL